MGDRVQGGLFSSIGGQRKFCYSELIELNVNESLFLERISFSVLQFDFQFEYNWNVWAVIDEFPDSCCWDQGPFL